MTMDRDRNETARGEPVETDEAGRKGGAVAAYPAAGVERPAAVTAGEATYLGVSRAAWGGIWAGFFIGTMTYILLGTLGLALGIRWMRLEQAEAGAVQTASAIWVIVTGLLSFFIGGFVAGRLAPLPGRVTGAMNGFLYGCFAVILLSVLMLTPVLSVLPTLFSMSMGASAVPVQPPEFRPEAAQSAAWWTLLGLVLALLAATLGGASGARGAAIDPTATGGTRARGYG